MRDHIGSWGLHLNKHGKGSLGNATHLTFQASKPSGSEEEN